MKDYIEGGRADNIPDNKFDEDQIEKGTKVEMEHTDNKEIAKEIAKDHIIEFKNKNKDDKYDNDYYDKLEAMEKYIKDDTEEKKFSGIKSLDQLIKQSDIKYKIWVDMDGVLVDFEKGFKKLTGIAPKDYEEKYSTEKFWSIIDNEPNFWVNLEWMPKGRELWSYVKEFNPIILTTPSRTNRESCQQQKKSWVRKHLGDYPVKFSFNKGEYADEDSILIDDMEHNIESWEEHDGIAILHINNKMTIELMVNIMDGGYNKLDDVVNDSIFLPDSSGGGVFRW